nr:hypothetical protein [Tanacetum cinerariifolium]
MSANDKFRLGYGDYRYGSILSYKNEVLQSVFINKESDLEDTPVNDRHVEGMHDVPPLMTRNYIPSGPDVETLQIVSAVQIVKTVSIRVNTVMYNLVLLARKNELKAHGTLLMALPEMHQLKFNIHKDAKTLLETIEKRFGGNKETKKVQKTLLRQQYENFTGSNLEDQSLDDLFNSLKIYEDEVKSSSTAIPTTQNIAFLSSQNTNSTNESVSATASAKVPVSALPNVDTLSDAVIYSFFASQSNSSQLNNDDLKQIDAHDVEEMDLKWKMAMLTIRERRFLQRTGRNLEENGTTSIRVDMSKVECYNCHRRGHFLKECKSPKDTRRNVLVETQRMNVTVKTSTSNALVSQCDGVGSYDWSFQAEEEPTNYALMAFTSSSSSSSDNELRDNALVILKKKFEKVEQERDELKLKLDKFQTSSKNLSQPLASQTNDQNWIRLQVFNSSMFDCDEMFSSESDVSMPASPVYDIYNSGVGYHVVPPPYTGTFMPLKPDLVFHDAPTVNETDPPVFNVELSPTKSAKDLSQSNRPSAPLIEDWVSDSKDDSKGEPKNTQIAPSFVQPTEHVKTPRPSVKTVEHLILAANLKTNISKPKGYRNNMNKKACFVCKSLTHLIKDYQGQPKMLALSHFHHQQGPSPPASNFHQKVTTTKAPQVNAVNGVQGNWAWKPKCPILDYVSQHTSASMTLKKVDYTDALGRSKHMTGNMSYLADFEEINGGYVAFGGNLKGGKITGKDPLGKFDGKAGEGFLVGYSVSSKVFRVFNSRTRIVQETLHINFLENQPNVAGSGSTWLFDIDTLTKSMNYQPVLAGNQPNLSVGIQEYFDVDKVGEVIVQQYVLFHLWSFGSKDPQNTDDDVTFEVKEPEFEVEKPESEVYVYPSSSTKTKKHDDKTRREAKGKNPVELSIGFRNLSEEFEDFFDNSISEVNAVSTPVPAVGQISTNSTNTFSAAGPSNSTVSPTHGKSLYVDPSQYPDDPNMLALEDITYSDDEEAVGAEADFPNLETTITVSLIPTTRVHKDHHVTQIISDFSLATQTRSMTRMVKDQGGLTQINNKDFHTCMFACFLSQKEPKREEGIDYEEVFAPVARIKAIRLFLAYSFFMGFMVYQMNVKSAFLYGTIEEEVYIDDIIFSSTSKELCKAFEKLMKDKFQMSSMGELTFFLGLQVKQKQDGIFISQDKYVAKILRKFGLIDGKSASTSIDTEKPLLKDPDGEDVNVYTYSFRLTMQVTQSSMKLLERTLHVTNVSSTGYITTPQMVSNSPCLTHIKN